MFITQPQDLMLAPGETLSWLVFILFQDPAQVLPVDLTGYVGAMSVAGLFTLTTDADTLVLGGPTGTIRPILTRAQTLAFPVGRYAWDLYVATVDRSDERRVFAGGFVVTPGVTTAP